MEIRRYRRGEEEALWTLLYETVHTVNRADYTAAQLDAWAPAERDGAQWRERLAATRPFVAEVAGRLAGFAELVADGCIDCFYCHKDWQRQGVGSALLAVIEEEARRQDATHLCAAVSITARPFFERKGFVVEAEQQVERRGATFTNYAMSKSMAC